MGRHHSDKEDDVPLVGEEEEQRSRGRSKHKHRHHHHKKHKHHHKKHHHRKHHSHARSASRSPSRGSRSSGSRSTSYPLTTSLYVGNIPFDIGKDQLVSLFSEVGRVQRLNLARDHTTGNSRGFCFVTYKSISEAEKAFKHFREYPLNGRRLKVDWDLGPERCAYQIGTEERAPLYEPPKELKPYQPLPPAGDGPDGHFVPTESKYRVKKKDESESESGSESGSGSSSSSDSSRRERKKKHRKHKSKSSSRHKSRRRGSSSPGSSSSSSRAPTEAPNPAEMSPLETYNPYLA